MMTALSIFGLLGKLWPFLLAGAGAIGVLFWGKKKEGIGAAKERAKLEKAAAAERHEMDREATGIERAVRDLTDEQARAEAKSWAKR